MPKSPPKSKRTYIVLPDDFEMPPTNEGETFEAIAEIRKEPDGKFCVVSIDGIPLDEDADETEEESIGSRVKMAMKGEY